MAIKEVDLPEATRRNDTFNDLMEISNHLSEMSVFPSLLWVWAFDIMKDIFDNNQFIHLAENDYSDAMESMERKYWEGMSDAYTHLYKLTYDLSFAIADLRKDSNGE